MRVQEQQICTLWTKACYKRCLLERLTEQPAGWAKADLITAFKQQTVVKRVIGKAACVAAKRLLNKALQVRKEHAGSTVQSMQITGAKDFGEGCHTVSTEPYFYDSAYKPVKRNYALPIDDRGKRVLADEIVADSKTSKYSCKNQPMKWACTSECKALTDDEAL